MVRVVLELVEEQMVEIGKEDLVETVIVGAEAESYLLLVGHLKLIQASLLKSIDLEFPSMQQH